MTAQTTTPTLPPPHTLSFEEALKELETIVKQLESGSDSLEATIIAYERGNALRTHCEQTLEAAKLRVEKIVKMADGSITTATFDAEPAS